MITFTWAPSYSVGIAEIDEQHQYFFSIANDIIKLADKKDSSKDELFTLLGKLGDYAMYHLSTEEEYFTKFEYPDVAPHIEAHNRFRTEIKKYLVDVREADVDVRGLAMKAALFSNDWLSGHILTMDKLYTKFFNEHGLV